MANTDKQNFRCDGETRWKPAMEKIEALQDQGYDVDMTKVLAARVDWIRDTPAETIVKALKLKKAA